MSDDKQNPYSSIQANEQSVNYSVDVGGIMLIIALAVLTIPAMAVAFFATCLVSFLAIESAGLGSGDSSFAIGMIAGTLGAILALALGSYLIFRVIRRARRVRREREEYMLKQREPFSMKTDDEA